MKNTKNKERNQARPLAAASQTEVMRFEYANPTARSVCVAGTFNNWNPSAGAMMAAGDGRWAKKIVLAPGSYEYCFVVDNVWVTDPQAATTTPNPFGGLNSVLQVPSVARFGAT